LNALKAYQNKFEIFGSIKRVGHSKYLDENSNDDIGIN